MPKDHQELTGMISVVTAQRGMDIIAHHVANLLGAVWLFQQVSCHRGGYNLGHVLMLRNGLNLLLCQTTQGNAILKRNHDATLSKSSSVQQIAPLLQLKCERGFHPYGSLISPCQGITICEVLLLNAPRRAQVVAIGSCGFP